MPGKINRKGEENINTFGSKMVIVEYRKAMDMDIYFPEYNWTSNHKQYGNFKKGNIKCPYDRSVYGVGYIGEGKYKVKENDEVTRAYKTWNHMMERCYDKKLHKKHPTYKNCKVSEKWHNFQNFTEWYEDNYYEVDDETMCLDKDILIKGNKIYSPETCIFVPNTINVLFTKRDSKRGETCIGTSYHKRYKVYEANCHLINPKTGKSKNKYLGRYNTELEAFEVYKYYKEKNIKEVADYFKKEIPDELYQSLHDYIVEITD